MKSSFYIYSHNIFTSGRHFYQPNTSTMFGRVSNGEIEFCHEIAFNNYGFRDSNEYSERNNSSQLRVAAIGDSFTVNLDSQHPWPEQLEQELVSKRGQDDVKVYNLGLAGAGPVNWAALRGAIQKIKPDIILVNLYQGIMQRPEISFYSNLSSRRFYCKYGFPVSVTKPIGVYDPLFPEIDKEILESYSYELYEELNAPQTPLQSLRVKMSSLYRRFDKNIAFRRNMIALDEILSWSRKTIISLFPSLHTIKNDINGGAEVEMISNIAKSNDVQFINFIDQFHGVDAAAIYTYSSNHWNDYGNSRVAQIFADMISNHSC